MNCVKLSSDLCQSNAVHLKQEESDVDISDNTAELILQSFSHFTYVTVHSSTLPLLHLRHSTFSSPSFASPALLILQAFHHFIYVTAHSSTLPALYLCHSSFSNHSVSSPTSQLILQPFFCFSYITGSSLTSPGEPLMGHANY